MSVYPPNRGQHDPTRMGCGYGVNPRYMPENPVGAVQFETCVRKHVGGGSRLCGKLVTPSYPNVERGAPLLVLCQAARLIQCDLERDGTSLRFATCRRTSTPGHGARMMRQ